MGSLDAIVVSLSELSFKINPDTIGFLLKLGGGGDTAIYLRLIRLILRQPYIGTGSMYIYFHDSEKDLTFN